MILRVPPVASNIAEWVRLAANAINRLAPLQDNIEVGPFADDAAAGDAGIPVGGLYRRPDGSVGWRQE